VTVAPPKIRRLLFIVGPDRRALYDSLRRTFADDDFVHVVLDRRVAERRRRRPRPRRGEQRQAERRAQLEIDRQLRARGYAVVGVRTIERPPAGTPAPAERKAR
jgi:hypothetical protein